MDQNDKNNKNRRGNRNLLGAVKLVAWALVLTLVFYCTSSYMGSAGKQASNINIKYSDFIAMMEGKQVEDVTVDLSEGLLYIVPKDGYVYTAENGTAYTKSTDQDGKAVYAFTDADGKEHTAALKLFTVKMESNDTLVERMHEAGKTDYDTKYEPQMSPLLLFAINFILPFVFIMLMFSLVMRIMAKKGGMGGMGGIGGVGKANAKVYMEKQTGVTFADVAGQDEAKESLTEIIDFLHNPKKYTDIGAKLPKGALLVGPPGTGKTLLAKAVAGEANVPFFSISGSDFVEMFVGVGASRVRDLFKEAAKVAPCIVFIDEIDTIGKSRDSGRFGGNDEREQTLNQLLAEMDGFDPTKGIILLAATNRPEVLDQALLRPGRFDRRIIIDRPNLAGRLATLQVHTRNIKLAEDVNLKKVALATAGCVGADLANLVNEAALRAVRKGRKLVIQEDLLAAFELVIAGTEKKGSVLTEFEKKLVAYHEVGHAMVAYKQKNTEPVQKITIVPHTQGALGYTLLMPEEDKTELRTRDELMAKIAVSMGGRAAEDEHHDQRRLSGHSGGHRRGPEHGCHVRHERPVRHDGSGLPPQPVSGRRLRSGLRAGHRRRYGQGREGYSGQVLCRRCEHHPGKPGGHGQGGGLSAGEGDHHRRGDGSHHRGPGSLHRGGRLRLHSGPREWLPPLSAGGHRACRPEGPHDLREDRGPGERSRRRGNEQRG